MSKLKIIAIRAGVGHVYLVIAEKEFFLVDTGTKGNENKIVKAITSRGLNIEALKFIFLTHTHYDHAGCAAFLKEKSGAKIIIHESEADKLKAGFHRVPDGTNPLFKVISFMGKRVSKLYNVFQPVEPDIVFGNVLDLNMLGVNGRIIHTPGHTSGSSSLIFENNAFVGDSLFNIMHKIYPPFANDEAALLESWKKLLKQNAELYYPAHGKRLKKEVLLKAYKERMAKKKQY
ncbi:MAG: MBL fold metallo-hydrolase [Bacteroidetes bacterium]|nr:MBL fold metallo-hydrolase [Bacteroidota bacterium]